MSSHSPICIWSCWLSVLVSAATASCAEDHLPAAEHNVVYGQVDGHKLLLDIYPSKTDDAAPVIVWIHGGAWRSGSKDKVPILGLRKFGYAIISVDYRLSPVAKFPAQIHDCKAAVRFVRGHAEKFHLDRDRIVVAGSSAGGHLVALIGTTNRHAALEGTIGKYLNESSDVQAIVDFYGPTNFMTILEQSTPHGLSVRVPALDLLLGGQPGDDRELARLASPVFHVGAHDPPLLMLHGDQDPQVPINQSHELHAAYKKYRRPVQFEVVHGGAHGGKGFYEADKLQLIDAFLRKHMK